MRARLMLLGALAGCVAHAEEPGHHPSPGVSSPIGVGLGEAMTALGALLGSAVATAVGVAAGRRQTPGAAASAASTERAAAAIEQSAARLDSTAAVIARLDERTEALLVQQQHLADSQKDLAADVRSLRERQHMQAQTLTVLALRLSEQIGDEAVDINLDMPPPPAPRRRSEG